MNYELAKELKDAGFPQAEMPQYDSEGYLHRTDAEIEHWVYKPSLEELIRACGTKFEQLQMRVPGWLAVGIASDFEQKRDKFFSIGEGNSPSEAVARLWIALNNKTS